MKTRDLEWYDLFHMRGTRRDFVRLTGSVTGLVALGALPACGTERSVAFSSSPFTLGVASGDPSPAGVVLSSRLARAALEPVGSLSESPAVGWDVRDGDRRMWLPHAPPARPTAPQPPRLQPGPAARRRGSVGSLPPRGRSAGASRSQPRCRTGRAQPPSAPSPPSDRPDRISTTSSRPACRPCRSR